MQVKEAIKKRRSIRRYLSKDISWKIISDLIDSAHYAPSSGNIQNWRFIIVKDDLIREKIAKACVDQLWMTEAPVFIVICSEKDNIKAMYGKRSKLYSIQNTSLAASNILHQAHSLNLGSCFISSFNESEIKDILNLPANIDPHAILTIGYPAEKPLSPRKKIDELLYFEKYGNTIRDTSIWPLDKTLHKLKKKLF